MDLRIEITQRQTLNQQMIQSMEILQMSAVELEDYIENLSMENPVIDLPSFSEDSSDAGQEELQRKLDWLESTDYQNRVYYQQDRYNRDDIDNLHDYESETETLGDFLLSQMPRQYDARDEAILRYLVQSLDDRGYFTEPLSEAAASFSCSEEHIGELLAEIKKLDPAGVGAADLKGCLLLQLERTGRDDPLTVCLVENHLEDIAKNHQQILARKLNRDPEEISASCDIIRGLNPKPGSAFCSREQLSYIRPDAVVVKLEDHFEILINEYQHPGFTINPYYQELYRETRDAETRQYLQEKIQQARWVESSIKNRTSTLSRVLRELVEIQEPFFLFGPGHKSPMRLSDLADRLELHESTVSRCMNGKYLQCSYGIFPLKYFLTPVVNRSGQTTPSSTTVEQAKEAIRRLIGAEDPENPYSDQAISDKLEESGIRLSRRTVNKYRAEMGIPDRTGRRGFDK